MVRLLVLALLAFAACANSKFSVSDAGHDTTTDAGSSVCVAGEGALPRALNLPNSEENGVFDPSFAWDSTTERLWMTFSSVSGPAGSGFVSTHLAYSDDAGTTWCDEGVVNQAIPVAREDQPPAIATDVGHWNHETPSIVHDPTAPNDARWRLMWHRYLHVDDGVRGNDDRHFEYGWFAERVAATPEQLFVAQERKVFSGTAYYATGPIQAYNDAAPGGVPQTRLDIDPELAGCLAFAEPALLASNSNLYVAAFCFRSQEDVTIELVARNYATSEWTHQGTLLTPGDAATAQASAEGFNAPHLFMLDGLARLVVSPVLPGPAYGGCIVYDVLLDAGNVLRIDGVPVERLHIPGNDDPGVFQTGACAFHEASNLGMVVGETWFGAPQFRLIATGQTPIGS